MVGRKQGQKEEFPEAFADQKDGARTKIIKDTRNN